MHKKSAALILSVLFLFTLFTSKTFALELTSIGALDTGGANYTEWWYTGLTPLLKGTATAGAQVAITFGEKAGTSTVDTSGVWTYNPGTLEVKDYPVTIKSGDDTLSFTLHAGQTMTKGAAPTDTTSGTTPEENAVPETGSNQVIALIFALTMALSSVYVYFMGRGKALKYFEQRVSRLN